MFTSPFKNILNFKYIIYISLFSLFIFVFTYSTASTVLRTNYPLDLNMWSEGPYLTNMLKIYNGIYIYGDPADANSYTYAPGLEYISYYTLRLFGPETPLNIVAARYLNISFNILASFILSMTLLFIRNPPKSKMLVPLAFPMMLVAVSHGWMFDVVHPDNLHLLLTACVFSLTLVAVRYNSLPIIILAITLGAGTLLIKQTGGALGIGAAVAAYLFLQKSFILRIFFLIYSLLITLLMIYVLYHDKFTWFYTYQLPSSQGIAWSHLNSVRTEILEKFPTSILFIGTIIAINFLHKKDKTWIYIWFIFFVFGCMPALVAFMKVAGEANNLTLIWVWLCLACCALLCPLALQGQTEASILIVAFIFVVIPLRSFPNNDNYKLVVALDESVAESIREKKKVLLSDGISALIKAGSRTIPFDLGKPNLELAFADKQSMADTPARVEHFYYDRIILTNANLYGEKVVKLIHDKYTLTHQFHSGPRFSAGDVITDFFVYDRKDASEANR